MASSQDSAVTPFPLRPVKDPTNDLRVAPNPRPGVCASARPRPSPVGCASRHFWYLNCNTSTVVVTHIFYQ